MARSKTARRRLQLQLQKRQASRTRAYIRKLDKFGTKTVVKILKKGPDCWLVSSPFVHFFPTAVANDPFNPVQEIKNYPGEEFVQKLVNKVNLSMIGNHPIMVAGYIIVSAEVTDIGEIWAKIAEAKPKNMGGH